VTTTSYLPEGMPIPVPTGDGLDAPFHEGLREHRLVVTRCPACGTWVWAPEVLCYSCHTFGLVWEEVQPNGVVYSWTRIWHPVRPQLAPVVPYIAVLVELPQAGNIRLIGNLLGDSMQDVHIGDRVRGVFEDHDGPPAYTLLQWDRGRP
jgi:uncharacterized OB-fold protein